MSELIRVEFRAPEAAEDEVALYLTQNAPHGWEEESGPGYTIYRVHFEEGRAAEEIVSGLSRRFPSFEMDVGRIAQRNWNEAWHEFFKPIEIAGEMTVVPSWLAGTAKTREIVIHPAMAFGTGHHATTRLCLETLVDLHKAGVTSGFESFLDLGTGSGILAIAAASLGLSGIGLDIDPVAVQNAVLNAETNSCGRRFLPAAGGLEALAENAKFDLVMANILSGPLIEMSEELGARLKPGGAMILSGILAEQSWEVEAAYSRFDLHGPEKKNEGEWVALIYRRPV